MGDSPAIQLLWLMLLVLAATVVAVLLVLSARPLFRWALRRAYRHEPRRCPSCGQAVDNVDMPQCPACGRAFGFGKTFQELGLDEAEIRRYRQQRRAEIERLAKQGEDRKDEQ